MTIWKFFCMEDDYPGLWQRWYRHQCVAVGWKESWGFQLRGQTERDEGWEYARERLVEIEESDKIVVHLRGNRFGRVGEVTGKAIEDDNWDPLVPRTVAPPDGEMGRRVFVRWDLTVGPPDADQVVRVPRGIRFPTQGAIQPIQALTWATIVEVMNDPGNWVGLLAFRYERALSEYIAAYPGRIEDGLLPHPSATVRERAFPDRTRPDVLLIDRNDRPVIVECKQYAPTTGDIEQLRRYLRQYEDEFGHSARGILVHGGSRKLVDEVRNEVANDPEVELVQYRLNVEFSACR